MFINVWKLKFFAFFLLQNSNNPNKCLRLNIYNVVQTFYYNK